MNSITTLCAIEAYLIMYSVYDPEPFVWPSNDEARKLIERFRSFSVGDQEKRKVNQETYMRQSREKLEEKVRKMEMENRLKEVTHIMFQSLTDTQAALSRLDMGGYVELRKAISKSMMEAQRMMDMRSREEDSFNPQAESVGGSGGGQNQLVLSHGFMSPIQSSNMTFPPPTMQFPTTNMTFPPPLQGIAWPSGSGGGQQLGLSHHEFMLDPNQYERVQPLSPRFSMPNVTFLPPNMASPPPPSMDFPPNDMAYMDPNTGMPYPSNQQMFPYYHNDDLSPHDPSFR